MRIDYKAAYYAQTLSTDPDRKVGACVVVDNKQNIVGCNDLVGTSVSYAEIGSEKLLYTIHAEAAALLRCAKLGISTAGARLQTTFYPCPDCAKLIIAAGIKTVVTPVPEKGSSWYPGMLVSEKMFLHHNIEIIIHEEN